MDQNCSCCNTAFRFIKAHFPSLCLLGPAIRNFPTREAAREAARPHLEYLRDGCFLLSSFAAEDSFSPSVDSLVISGRRLKGAGQTRSGEEEQPAIAWGHGDREERAGKKDVVMEARHAAARAQGGQD